MGTLITIAGLILFIFGGVFACYFMLAFFKTNRLRLRDPIDKTRYIADFWVWEKKDRQSGIMYWQSVFWQPKIKTPAPPSNAVDVGQRGKKFAEAYKISEDEFVWITDKGIKIVETIDKKTNKKVKQIIDVKEDGTHTVIDTFSPFTSTQRDTLISQYKKAAEISANRWTPDKIIMGGTVMLVFILIILIVIYWGELAQPLIDMQSNTANLVSKMNEITANQAAIANAQGVKLDGYVAPAQTAVAQKTSNVMVSTDPVDKLIGRW